MLQVSCSVFLIKNMAKTTTDKVQLVLEINGTTKASANLKELGNAAKSLNAELSRMSPGTEEFARKSRAIKDCPGQDKRNTRGDKGGE